MRSISLLTLISLLLIGAGCFQSTPSTPLSLPEQPTQNSTHLAGDLTITEKTLSQTSTLNEHAGCQASISYPHLEAGELSATSLELFNQTITSYLATNLEFSGDFTNLDDLKTVVDSYLDNCYQQIEAEYAYLEADQEFLLSSLKRSLEITYHIKLNQNGLLSFGLSNYSYNGGAHPNNDTQYHTFDLNSGQTLSLSDVVAADQLKALIQLEKTKLLANEQENIYQDVSETYLALLADTTIMTAEEQLAAYGTIKNFYLTPSALVFYYNSYDIAPYAAGPMQVELPWEQIESFLIPNSAVATLVATE